MLFCSGLTVTETNVRASCTRVPNTNPRLGKYLTHAHSRITKVVTAMKSCSPLLGLRCSKALSCQGLVQSAPLSPAQHNTYGCCWLETARQFSHGMRREGGSAFLPICALVNPVRPTGREVGWCTCVTYF